MSKYIMEALNQQTAYGVTGMGRITWVWGIKSVCRATLACGLERGDKKEKGKPTVSVE